LTDVAPEEKVTVEGIQQLNPCFSHWHRQDQLILSWLCSSLSDTILNQVVSCDTSATLWKSLQQFFSATSQARLSELRRSLQTTTKDELSCADYCQKMRSLADELAFIGSPIF
jgi:gag-polypeptide of LTR copia-type